jgi:hypothetical protein
MLDDDTLCRHAADALDVISGPGAAGRPSAVLVCRDCGAELRIWVGDRQPASTPAGTTAGDVLKYHGP